MTTSTSAIPLKPTTTTITGPLPTHHENEMGMSMVFNFHHRGLFLLLPFWSINSTASLITSVFVLFVLAVIDQYLAVATEHYFKNRSVKPISDMENHDNAFGISLGSEENTCSKENKLKLAGTQDPHLFDPLYLSPTSMTASSPRFDLFNGNGNGTNTSHYYNHSNNNNYPNYSQHPPYRTFRLSPPASPDLPPMFAASVQRKVTRTDRILKSAVYAVRTTLHYCLMFAAMTMNVWIFLGIILGWTLGFFLFHSK